MKLDLLLLRHAKSDWDSGSAGDHDRPLAPRGLAAAEGVGKWLAESGLTLDLAISSTAVRAAETARIVLRAGGFRTPLRLEASFYEAAVADLIAAVTGLDEDYRRVLLVGHEPTWSALVSTLIGGGRVRMPTAALAGVRFELASWSEVRAGSGELRFLVTPRIQPD